MIIVQLRRNWYIFNGYLPELTVILKYLTLYSPSILYIHDYCLVITANWLYVITTQIFCAQNLNSLKPQLL